MSDNNTPTHGTSAHLPAYTQAHIKQQLLANGASGTIYAYPFPESQAIIEDVLDGGSQQGIVTEALQNIFANVSSEAITPALLSHYVMQELNAHRAEYRDMFKAAWTSRQDHVDPQFFDAWRKWSAPAVTLAPELSNNAYPTAGASEGLREVIDAYGNQARAKGFTPTIHVFHGEYEGFGAYAEAANIRVVRHDRSNWGYSIEKIGPNDQFYISQPSAIDGNVWPEFDSFARALHTSQPKAKLMLDLTYVGSVAKDFHIDATHPNIPTVFFSLSKPFGVYYHRIGGVLSKEAYPGLLGNKWFKGLQGMRAGTALLERSDVYALPRKYEDLRQQALANVSERLGVKFNASDVTLFATAQPAGDENEVMRSLKRGTPGREFLRICITPELSRLITPAQDPAAEAAPIQLPRAINGPHILEM